MSVIDQAGYRANVGSVLVSQEQKVFWGRRVRQKTWQFPQGGLLADEELDEALYRELQEEIGLHAEDVQLVAETNDWIKYDIPQHLIRYRSKPLCIGQKQKWFLLKFIGDERQINLHSSESPEFDGWRWVDYWLPEKEIVDFKQEVYHSVLKEFESYVFNSGW